MNKNIDLLVLITQFHKLEKQFLFKKKLSEKNNIYSKEIFFRALIIDIALEKKLNQYIDVKI